MRAATFLCAVPLATEHEPDPSWAAAALLAATAAHLAATSAWTEWRLRRSRPPDMHAILAVDVVLLALAIAATGGTESSLRLLVTVFPISIAFSVIAPAAAALEVVPGLGILLYEPTVRELLSELAVVAVGAIVAMGIARRRNVAIARLTRLGTVRQLLLARDDAGPGERRRVGETLREVAIEPLRDLRGSAATGDTVEIAGRLDRIVRAVRGVVTELHALSARPISMHGALQELTAQRAPRAVVEVRVADELSEAAQSPVLSLARDGLSLLTTPETARVGVVISCEDDGSVTIAIEAEPPPARPPAVRRAAFEERTAQLGGTATFGPGHVRATLTMEPLPDPVSAALPGGTQADSVDLLVLTRTIGLAGVLLGGLAAGGTHPAFAALCVAALVIAPFHERIIRSGFAPWAALGVLDWVFFALIFMTADDAQSAVLPISLCIPAAYAFVMLPAGAAGASVGAGLAMVAAGATSAPFLGSFAWATLCGVALCFGLTQLRAGIVQLEQRRLRLVRSLFDDADQVRRRLGGELHDDALQLLLVARQDLEEAADGDDLEAHDRALVVLARAHGSLEHAASGLDIDAEVAAVTGGLYAALGEVQAEAEAIPGAPVISIDLDPAAEGVHDGLVVKLVRELVTNARKHANAGVVRVAVAAVGNALLLEVRDDGLGFDFGMLDDAVERGHVGLAFVRDRVDLAGGRLDVANGLDGGAVVQVLLPVPTAVPA